MSITNLNPYLNFNGNAEKAIKLYERALGAKTENLMRWSEMPAGEGNVSPEHKNRVMHAHLQVGQGELMIADTLPDRPVKSGDNAHISLNFDDIGDMKKKFDALSTGGQVVMPLQDTFWGAKFGILKDEFGVQWMFNCQKTEGGNGDRGAQR